MIKSLKPGEIFVFGSNLRGAHGGGAALQAWEEFGAEQGIGEGLTGQCYAFPTLKMNMQKRTFTELNRSRDQLYATAHALPGKTFLLTKVGCGIAGYSESKIKALFVNAPWNVVLPADWLTKEV